MVSVAALISIRCTATQVHDVQSKGVKKRIRRHRVFINRIVESLRPSSVSPIGVQVGSPLCNRI